MCKICTSCSESRIFGEFHKNKSRKDGYSSWCKKCSTQKRDKSKKRSYDKEHYAKTRESELVYQKKYYQKNKEAKINYQKEYYQKNKEKILNHRKNNREPFRKYIRNKRRKDINFKLANNLRARFRDALKNNYKAGSAVADLGCAIKELKEYLESKFQSGMTWQNYGYYGWHIDHIRPLASFDLTDRKQFLEACHYTNLQPLWAKDNLSKGKKICSQ